jgi:hypothetical protein
VDDLLIFGKDIKNVEKVKGLHSDGFMMKDIGELKFYAPWNPAFLTVSKVLS